MTRLFGNTPLTARTTKLGTAPNFHLVTATTRLRTTPRAIAMARIYATVSKFLDKFVWWLWLWLVLSVVGCLVVCFLFFWLFVCLFVCLFGWLVGWRCRRRCYCCCFGLRSHGVYVDNEGHATPVLAWQAAPSHWD